MNYCLFLVYKPHNLNCSINKLYKFLSKIGEPFKILIIFNGDNVKYQLRSEIFSISGDNHAWEFSGWSEGKNYLLNEFSLSKEDRVFLVNDTYDKHHYFSLFTSKLYRNIISRNNFDRYALGESHYSKSILSVLGLNIDSWLSSYFFVMDGETFSKINFVSKEICDAKIKVLHHKLEIERLVINDKLEQHISTWLRSPEDSPGWYNRNSTHELIKGKSRAILHEKYLSAQLKKMDVSIINAYSTNFGRIVYKLDLMLFKIRSLLKPVK